jgi:transposase
VPRRPFGPRLTAVVALLSGRYRLSRREVRQLVEDLWAVRLSLAEIERLFTLWHRFRADEFDRKELRRRLVPVQARLGRLLGRGQESPDRKAAALCRQLNKWWAALWTFARLEGVEPTNNVAERALRPAVLWRKGSFGSDSEAGSRFAERLLTVVASCRQQGRRLLDLLVAAGEAALQGTAAPSLLSSQLGVGGHLPPPQRRHA